jgi:hypothetical protein
MRPSFTPSIMLRSSVSIMVASSGSRMVAGGLQRRPRQYLEKKCPGGRWHTERPARQLIAAGIRQVFWLLLEQNAASAHTVSAIRR